ncbi:hypothetical protein AYI69_g9256 [Smittium culicis]|uniref:Outer spore wall protein RRT8 n=1 Tax=Smittium culicis TaxID=133412 RepID=A0A1R1XDU4_9FUNG|nr:hypothetical protein AYI69_g9256 [Smittium culicis]
MKDFYEMGADTIGFVVGGAPFIILELVSRIFPTRFESVFFASMDYFDPSYSKTLQNRKPTTSMWNEIVFTFDSSIKRLVISKTANFISIIPFVGILAYPVAHFFLLIELVGLHLSIVISIAMLAVPIFDNFSAQSLILILSARELATNFLRPYMRRTLLSRNDQAKLFVDNYLYFIGYSIFFYYTSQIPFVGPIFYTFGFVAVALPVAKFAQKAEILKIAEFSQKKE